MFVLVSSTMQGGHYMDRKTKTIKKRFDRSSFYYDWMDRMVSDSLREKAVAMASGQVLEVGVGTGKNFHFYPAGCEVTAIDFSKGMLAQAKKKVSLAKVPITLLEMDAQDMTFADDSFDTVLATCVFCSVPDPVKGLKEVRRVCKPDGQIILLEHMRSEHPLMGLLMDILNPVSLYVIGSNINRETMQNILAAGIQISTVEDYKGKIVKLIVAKP
jgi:ubiquinone/menaquinone biosynthesis C-methylase UbiE